VFPGPDDRFAYAPDLGIDKVMIYRILREEGKMEVEGFAAVPPGSGPRHMKFGGDGRHAYVLNELTLTVAVFEVEREGGGLRPKGVVGVLPEGESIEGMTCSEIRVSRDGRHVYTANRDTAKRGRDSVSVFEVAADGGLRRIQTAPAGVSVPRNIALEPGGKWLLVCGQESNEVAVLPVDPAGGRVGAKAHRAALDAPMCVTFARP
jgi:6-phosphogluconolactonase